MYYLYYCIESIFRDVDYAGFENFLDKFFIPAYAKSLKKDAAAISDEVKKKIISNGPKAHGVTVNIWCWSIGSFN